MSMNILESLKGLFTDNMIDQASSMLGEDQSGIAKALSGLAPVVLSGVIGKASAGHTDSVMDLASKAAGSGILDNTGSLFSGSGSTLLSTGAALVSSLFGNKSGNLINAVSGFAGIKSSSSNSLLSAVAPLALGLIGKYVSSNNLSAGGLLSWLMGQKNSVQQALPAGLNIAGLFDSAEKPVSETIKKVHRETTPPPAGMPKFLLPLLLLVLGALAVWYFLRGSGNHVPSTPLQTEVAPVETAPAAPVTYKVTLADGTELNAMQGGIEDKIVKCIGDPSCAPGKDLWFDFDNINFELGSANLTAESQAQINNIAAILKAYPALKIKIGGYTDKTGDAAANKKLSQDRADNVMAAIVAAGGNKSQIEGAEGYGSAFAKVPAEASDEERKTDRRISVSVRAK